LVGCGKRGYDDWDRYVLQETIEWLGIVPY
jgi:hypothetical protein